MTKEEIALQLTLAILEKFDYKVSEYDGNTMTEHQEYLSKIATNTFNHIYNSIDVKN
ncbi:hypothetical protein ABEV55_12400 [Aneurinibacillus thermoaerophilus]|uniref:hypothetical protein n=1 Tax=Aneurinibacillus thermoaerophilus TaxID=143495 RepID=UPI002E1BA0F0|nr:hypothetical protein [Aneurinibacillus thermoaerophilus]